MPVTLQPVRKRLFCSLLAVIACVAGIAQGSGGGYFHSIKPTTDFDQRFYYPAGEVQNVWGYRFGVLVNDKYKVGLGGYFMNQSTDANVPVTSLSRTTTPDYSTNKKLYLGTVYYEPYLLRRNLWEASLVFETGYGRTVTSQTDMQTEKTLSKNNAMIVPAGAGLSFNFKFPPIFHVQCFRWIGINAMAGYRASIYQHDKEYNYNGAYWSLSGAIFLDRVFEDFHSWKKERKERIAARSKRAVQLYY